MRRFVEHAEEGFLVFLMAVMTVVAFVNVVTRYFIRFALAFTEEIVVSLFVWLTLLGTAIAFRQGRISDSASSWSAPQRRCSARSSGSRRPWA
jgi:TRAP-type C4-dicarboxylate transport system permease small subunit